jgi:sulfur carrier protein
MKVTINGELHTWPGGKSLAEAVAALTSAGSGVAAAVNGEVVRRGAWATTQLAEGDQVEVLTAVQGG